MMKRTLKNRVFTFVIAFVTMFAVLAMNVTAVSAFASDGVIGNYADDYELEWGNTFEFCAPTGDGTATYNFSVLFQYTDDDLDEFNNLLLNPDRITGLHIQRYDSNGDDKLNTADFVEMTKEVTLPSEGFTYTDGGWYPYQLKPKAEINAEDIDTVGKILTHIIKPNGGAYTCRYDYDFNGRINLYDAVLMNRYYSTNPCHFIKDLDGNEIQPDVLVSLLEAANNFGIENFIIRSAIPSTVIPYSIVPTYELLYTEIGMYECKPMQILPVSDSSLEGLEMYKRSDNGNDWALWRWAGEDENFDDMMWCTTSQDFVLTCYVSAAPFVLIPLDENGNKLESLIKND